MVAQKEQTGNCESVKNYLVGQRSPLICGLLNIRPAVQKAALMHDMIDNKNLDLLVLTETWIDSKAPPAIKKDIAPEGYVVIHADRSGKSVRGGGIAVVYSDTFRLLAGGPQSRLSKSSASKSHMKSDV